MANELMNPDECLRQIRLCYQQTQLMGDRPLDALQVFVKAADLFEQLDCWLIFGGELPVPWLDADGRLTPEAFDRIDPELYYAFMQVVK